MQKFDLQGTPIWKAGSNGAGDGQLSAPGGPALYNGHLYVADTNNRRIAVFDAANGAFVKNIGQGGTDANQLAAPVAVAFDSAGKMFVADSANKRIQVYDRDESPVRMIAGASGREDAFGTLGPGGVIVDAKDTVWASDPSNHRLMQFDFNGKYFAQVAAPIDAPSKLDGPIGVALDRNGKIYVADPAARQVFIFNADATLAGTRSAANLLIEPTFVAVDASTTIYVADAATLRVVVLSRRSRIVA